MHKKDISKSNYPFIVTMETRWRDLDSFQHVNNAVYATYIENARATMFDRWGLSHNGKGKSLILVSLKIDYLKELIHPTWLEVYQRISRIGNTSFDIESVIFIKNKNTPICLALATCVCYDFTRNKPVPVFSKVHMDYSKNTN